MADDGGRRILVADVRRLRNEVDLGLRMAQNLAETGDTGSALRLVEELRAGASRTLVEPSNGWIRERGLAPVWRRRRRTVALGVAAALLGVASAAALVAPRRDTPRPDRGRPAVTSSPAVADAGIPAPATPPRREPVTEGVRGQDVSPPAAATEARPPRPGPGSEPPTLEPPIGPEKLPTPPVPDPSAIGRLPLKP